MKKKYVLAVSGGVDSVVLLDMLYKKASSNLVVAHFDHGIRETSHEDAEFVKKLAGKYNLPFEMKREELGAQASEDKARIRRYNFLESVAKKYGAKIVTAHHLDDVIETIAINLVRSTGWRGLAVFDSQDLYRPMLEMTKEEIILYAKNNNLSWREDHTNSEQRYLRNRLRLKMSNLEKSKKEKLISLWHEQLKLKKSIEVELDKLVTKNANEYERYLFIMVDEIVALEILRHLTDAKLTRPQMKRALSRIKTAKSGSVYQAGSFVEFHFTPRFFKVKMLK